LNFQRHDFFRGYDAHNLVVVFNWQLIYGLFLKIYRMSGGYVDGEIDYRLSRFI
jgi:hypothetical protein